MSESDTNPPEPVGPSSDVPDLAALPPPRWPNAPITPMDDDAYLPFSNWSYGNIALALVTGVILGPFLAVLAIAAVRGPDALDDVPTLVMLGVQAASSLGAIFLLSRFRGSGSWRDDYGFKLELRHFWGIGAGMVLQFAVALLTYPLVEQFSQTEGPQQEIARIAEDLTGSEILLFGLLVAVLLPVFEEVVFRGMLLGKLVKSMSRRSAALLSAAAFAAIHLLDPNALLVVPGLFLVGVALAYAAYHSRNLSLPIFMHLGVNGLAVLLLAFQDQIEKLTETVETIVRFI